MKLILKIELEVEPTAVPIDSDEWNALEDVLMQRGVADDLLILHSNYFGDSVGLVKVISIDRGTTGERQGNDRETQ